MCSLNPKTKSPKKISLTIKASIIGAIILAGLGGLIFPLLLKGGAHIWRKINESPSLVEQAKIIIKKSNGDKDILINNADIVWVDLLSKDNIKEFYVTYSIDEINFVDVFTTRNGFNENILHQTSEDGEIDAKHVTINNKTYFICIFRGGNHRFMDVELYEYDGIGKLKLVYETNKELPQGKLWIVNNKIFISGGINKYELKYDGKKFSCVPYRERLSRSIGSGTHFLVYNISDNKLKIAYDGKVIKFKKLNEGLDSYQSISPLKLNYNELIYIDDNLTNSSYAEIYTLSDMSFQDGLFTTLKPDKKGKTGISIRHDHNEGYTWYHIDVIIE